MKVTVQYLPASHTVTHNVTHKFTELYLFPKMGLFPTTAEVQKYYYFLIKGKHHTKR